MSKYDDERNKFIKLLKRYLSPYNGNPLKPKDKLQLLDNNSDKSLKSARIKQWIRWILQEKPNDLSLNMKIEAIRKQADFNDLEYSIENLYDWLLCVDSTYSLCKDILKFIRSQSQELISQLYAADLCLTENKKLLYAQQIMIGTYYANYKKNINSNIFPPSLGEYTSFFINEIHKNINKNEEEYKDLM